MDMNCSPCYGTGTTDTMNFKWPCDRVAIYVTVNRSRVYFHFDPWVPRGFFALSGHERGTISAGRECWLAASVPSRFPDRQTQTLAASARSTLVRGSQDQPVHLLAPMSSAPRSLPEM